MTEIIAIAALVISVLVLIVQYVNQKERRHGELVRLRSDFLTRMSSIQQRLTAYIVQAETLRLELRSLPDTEEKYEAIEMMPSTLEGSRLICAKVKRLKSVVESQDTRQINRSDVLLRFQSSSHDLTDIESDLDDLESRMLDLFTLVRAEQTEQQGKDSFAHRPSLSP